MCLHSIINGSILEQTLKMGPIFSIALYFFLCSLSLQPNVDLSVALFIMLEENLIGSYNRIRGSHYKNISELSQNCNGEYKILFFDKFLRLAYHVYHCGPVE